ncbi:hypothetical protein AS888_17415 [Peribacillus simplex]|uniref:Uncharacterized protein n=1 Tax=Peribacillus simplex TaxID=1478 RepID=A0A109N0S3_9BACI|nr:hypothetical protein AS888_17415 [Peribacillus simplex]
MVREFACGFCFAQLTLLWAAETKKLYSSGAGIQSRAARTNANPSWSNTKAGSGQPRSFERGWIARGEEESIESHPP